MQRNDLTLVLLYISQIKRTYKSQYNGKIDFNDIPDIFKSIHADVDIIVQAESDIIEKCWSKTGLVEFGIDHVNEPEEFSTVFEAQLNLIEDRSLEIYILLNSTEEIPYEEADSEPIEKKTRQLSILEF